MRCPECNAECHAEASFCSECGRRLGGRTSGLPNILAWPLRDYFAEDKALLRLHRLVDVFEITTRFCTVVALGELHAQHGDALPEKVLSNLHDNISTPTLGKWVAMLRALVTELQPRGAVVPELHGFVTSSLLALTAEGKADASDDDDQRSPETCFIDLRNHIVHGGAITEHYARH